MLFGLGLLGCVALAVWIYHITETPNAVIDNNFIPLGAQFHTQVMEVLVQKNEHVLAGQTLVRLSDPTKAANAAGVESLREVESSFNHARALEEEAERDVQRKSTEHAKLQLELRRLDGLSVLPEQRIQAREDEHAARLALEKAQVLRVERSNMRIAAEGKWKRARAGHPAPEPADKTSPDRARKAERMPSHVLPDFLGITAPADATVTEIFARPGMTASPGDPLVTLKPDFGYLVITAWFPESRAADMQPGQMCSVFVSSLPGKIYSGTVAQVLPADSLSPSLPAAVPIKERTIPVRIRFSAEDIAQYAELIPGTRVAVFMHYFTPPWSHIDLTPIMKHCSVLLESIVGFTTRCWQQALALVEKFSARR